MRETLTRKFSIFDESLETDNLQFYSQLFGWIFGNPPTFLTLTRMKECLGLGRTSLSSASGVYRYLPHIWRFILGIFIIFGWIHFCLLRPGVNVVVQIPIYSTPLCAYFFGPSTMKWMESHQVHGDIIKYSKDVLNENGWFFYALPSFVTLFQLFAYFIFARISETYLFYGTQHAHYFPSEAFFVFYYSTFWLYSGLLLGFVVAHCMIWMRIHEKQLKLYRNFLISNANMNCLPNPSLSPHRLSKIPNNPLLDRESSVMMRRTEGLSGLPSINQFGIQASREEVISQELSTSIPFTSVTSDSSSLPTHLTIQFLQPETLMTTHEIFRKSVHQSSQCCSYFTISIFLFATADYFFLLLVLRKETTNLNIWTFIRVILWMILTFLVFASAARVTQSWHQMGVTIAAIRVLNSSLATSSSSSSLTNSAAELESRRSENLRRQWDELVSYFDHVRYSNGYKYQFGAIPITPALLAKCCVAVIYASYLILHGFN
jgi:hypothetical protein